jgi:hypothetical protein
MMENKYKRHDFQLIQVFLQMVYEIFHHRFQFGHLVQQHSIMFSMYHLEIITKVSIFSFFSIPTNHQSFVFEVHHNEVVEFQHLQVAHALEFDPLYPIAYQDH